VWLQRKFEEIGKINFNSVNLRKKNAQKMEKFDQLYKPQN